MEHDFGASYVLVEACRIEGVSFDELELRASQRIGDELPPACGKIVIPNNSVPLLQELVDESAADESGSACNKSAHDFLAERDRAIRSALLQRERIDASTAASSRTPHREARR